MALRAPAEKNVYSEELKGMQAVVDNAVKNTEKAVSELKSTWSAKHIPGSYNLRKEVETEAGNLEDVGKKITTALKKGTSETEMKKLRGEYAEALGSTLFVMTKYAAVAGFYEEANTAFENVQKTIKQLAVAKTELKKYAYLTDDERKAKADELQKRMDELGKFRDDLLERYTKLKYADLFKKDSLEATDEHVTAKGTTAFLAKLEPQKFVDAVMIDVVIPKFKNANEAQEFAEYMGQFVRMEMEFKSKIMLPKLDDRHKPVLRDGKPVLEAVLSDKAANEMKKDYDRVLWMLGSAGSQKNTEEITMGIYNAQEKLRQVRNASDLETARQYAATYGMKERYQELAYMGVLTVGAVALAALARDPKVGFLFMASGFAMKGSQEIYSGLMNKNSSQVLSGMLMTMGGTLGAASATGAVQYLATLGRGGTALSYGVRLTEFGIGTYFMGTMAVNMGETAKTGYKYGFTKADYVQMATDALMFGGGAVLGAAVLQKKPLAPPTTEWPVPRRVSPLEALRIELTRPLRGQTGAVGPGLVEVAGQESQVAALIKNAADLNAEVAAARGGAPLTALQLIQSLEASVLDNQNRAAYNALEDVANNATVQAVRDMANARIANILNVLGAQIATATPTGAPMVTPAQAAPQRVPPRIQTLTDIFQRAKAHLEELNTRLAVTVPPSAQELLQFQRTILRTVTDLQTRRNGLQEQLNRLNPRTAQEVRAELNGRLNLADEMLTATRAIQDRLNNNPNSVDAPALTKALGPNNTRYTTAMNDLNNVGAAERKPTTTLLNELKKIAGETAQQTAAPLLLPSDVMTIADTVLQGAERSPRKVIARIAQLKDPQGKSLSLEQKLQVMDYMLQNDRLTLDMLTDYSALGAIFSKYGVAGRDLIGATLAKAKNVTSNQQAVPTLIHELRGGARGSIHDAITQSGRFSDGEQFALLRYFYEQNAPRTALIDAALQMRAVGQLTGENSVLEQAYGRAEGLLNKKPMDIEELAQRAEAGDFRWYKVETLSRWFAEPWAEKPTGEKLKERPVDPLQSAWFWTRYWTMRPLAAILLAATIYAGVGVIAATPGAVKTGYYSLKGKAVAPETAMVDTIQNQIGNALGTAAKAGVLGTPLDRKILEARLVTGLGSMDAAAFNTLMLALTREAGKDIRNMPTTELEAFQKQGGAKALPTEGKDAFRAWTQRFQDDKEMTAKQYVNGLGKLNSYLTNGYWSQVKEISDMNSKMETMELIQRLDTPFNPNLKNVTPKPGAPPNSLWEMLKKEYSEPRERLNKATELDGLVTAVKKYAPNLQIQTIPGKMAAKIDRLSERKMELQKMEKDGGFGADFQRIREMTDYVASDGFRDTLNKAAAVMARKEKAAAGAGEALKEYPIIANKMVSLYRTAESQKEMGVKIRRMINASLSASEKGSDGKLYLSGSEKTVSFEDAVARCIETLETVKAFEDVRSLPGLLNLDVFVKLYAFPGPKGLMPRDIQLSPEKITWIATNVPLEVQGKFADALYADLQNKGLGGKANAQRREAEAENYFQTWAEANLKKTKK